MFLDLARHINARMRHMYPSLHENENDEGASLPLLGTPPPAEKEESFLAGAEVIHDYLIGSDDGVEEKLKAAGMAAEALIIWVHPFNDGNGRTSRFVGKFIEDGADADGDGLAQETADGKYRQRVYTENMRIDTWNTMYTLIESGDLLIDEDEIAEIEKTQMPFKDGIAQSIRNLLNNKQLQDQILERSRVRINRFLAHIAAKEAA
ncbi:Fic family protein [Candidatus Saccharibacteria bacterium]|nr:MAG: Fic family protein [Candidatus Saccharibacteria bacterium]